MVTEGGRRFMTDWRKGRRRDFGLGYEKRDADEARKNVTGLVRRKTLEATPPGLVDEPGKPRTGTICIDIAKV